MKRLSLILFAVSVSLASAWSAPYPEIGTRSVNILSLQPGARPRAMGGAFTAVPNDVNALWHNPAGFGTIKYWDIMATHRTFLSDIQQSHVGTVIPLGALTSENVRDFGALGFSIGMLNYGTLFGRDQLGLPSSEFRAEDGLLTAGYGKSVGPLAFGASVKIYRLKISDQKAKGTAYDLGLLYKRKASLWGFGAAVRNLGGNMSYAQRDEELPQEMTAGFVATPLRDRVVLTADLVSPKDSYAGYRAGAEFWANRIIALRGGYDSTWKAGNGFSGGIGIRLERLEAVFFPIRQMTIDYAFVPADNLDNTHNISVTFRFGE